MRYHYKHIKMAIIKFLKPIIPRAGDKEKQLDVSYIASSNAKWMAALENLAIFIKFSLHLQYGSAVFILNYYPRDIKTLDRTKTCA